MRSFKILFLLSIVLFSYYSEVHAKIINAADGTTAGIQAAVNQAAAGDTVRIPAGTFNYSGSISMNAGITILGAGRNSTILNKTGSSTTPMFVVNGSNGRRVTIGQFTLSGITSSGSTMQDNGIRINSCTDFHIFDITFKNFGYSAVYVTGNSRGVIRKCSFNDIFRSTLNNYGYGVVIYGDRDGSWNRPLNLGSGDAIYIEDCRFSNNRHAAASNDGSKYVFRYNTVVDNAGNFQSVDAHGREYGSPRGSRSFEVYNNTIDNSVRNAWCSIMIRGGDGVIFNNSLLRGTGNAPILLCNRTDGTHSNASYPAPDQTRSLYVWNNKRSNGSTVGVTVREGHERFFQLGRDYFHTEMPGYKPYTYPHPLAETQEPDIKDEPVPDGTNLINEKTLYQHCGSFNAGNPLSALWDGNISGDAASSPGSGTVDSFWVEFDFKDIHQLSTVRLFGDAVGNWVSKTFSVYVKADEFDQWTTIVDNKDCFGNRWFEFETDAKARFLRLVVLGNPLANSVQVRGFEVYGEALPSPPSAPTSIIKSRVMNSAKPGIIERTSEGALRYNVPKTARVKLTVHDLRGRTLSVNFDKVMPPGIHELQINSLVNNGVKMAAGQYIYRLSIGEETFTVSSTLMRK